ncbi:MAG: hypothetical protein DRN12_03515, partial [Thermoplasmata archaeon]
MISEKNLLKSIGIFILPLVFILSNFNAAGFSNIYSIADYPSSTIGNEYKGHLRIYIVEIESRWDMENGAPYHYAMLDFAFDDDISIRYLDTYEDTINWQGDVDRDNVIVMAAVFNAEEHTGYADPPDGRPFKAHYVDAAAAAKPGETSSNTVNDQFTHTVFCEVGTASWCPACPKMASELKAVFDKGDYPFYFVELVVDKNSDANRRMNQYNLKYLPTAFYDGGKEVVVGGGRGTSYHENMIKNCGKRDVHELDFNLSVEWLGEGSLGINISITNKEPLPNDPPEKPTITGPTQGKPGEELEYNIKTTDPDGDDVYYYIDWGDNTTSDWIGPYKSGEKVTVSHTWDAEGYYIIKVKAKDPDGEESDWQWLKVSMPYNLNIYH